MGVLRVIVCALSFGVALGYTAGHGRAAPPSRWRAAGPLFLKASPVDVASLVSKGSENSVDKTVTVGVESALEEERDPDLPFGVRREYTGEPVKERKKALMMIGPLFFKLVIVLLIKCLMDVIVTPTLVTMRFFKLRFRGAVKFAKGIRS